MKNALSIVLLLLLSVGIYAQAPEGFNYQALAKDAAGNIIVSTTIGVQIQVRETSIAGSVIYTETHSPTTNANGVFNLIVGQGTSTDTFNTIDWANDLHFLEISIDITNGSGYVSVGTTQFMSIPYALQATTAIELTGGIDQGYIVALEARIAALEPQPAVIGDIREGGVVFWVDPTDNTHGLVCAFTNHVSTVQWACSNTDLINVPNVTSSPPSGLGAEIGDGMSNTSAILIDCPTAPTALWARSVGADWFLPSAKELNEMYVNKVTLEAVPGFEVFGGLSYWSSTENVSNNAWLQNFDSGYQVNANKIYPSSVRAVRAF
ncbi:MAG: hypothetical protein ACI9OS_002562 [Ulvibacter sp.]|jgi:hypothetical protein